MRAVSRPIHGRGAPLGGRAAKEYNGKGVLRDGVPASGRVVVKPQGPGTRPSTPPPLRRPLISPSDARKAAERL